MQALAVAFMATVAVGGVAWVFLYPLLSGEKKAEERRASFARTEPVARQIDRTQRNRREQVESTLKEVEARHQREKKVAIATRLTQAGLDWTPKNFYIGSCALGFAVFVLVFLISDYPCLEGGDRLIGGQDQMG